MQFRRTVPIAVLILAFAAACRRAPEVPAPVATTPAAAPEPAAAPASNPDADRAAREAADREARAREERAAARAIITAAIHFAYDRSDLTLETRAQLDSKLVVLRDNPAMRIRVDGHADDRGSSEYNLALGMRRAAAARRYLVQRDIEPERIEITSLGEERPLCQMPDEICWQMNRRAEFVIVSQ